MKNVLLIFLSLYCGSLFGQVKFEKGYFLNAQEQRVNCFIKNADWDNNPTQFDYKLSEQGTTRSATIETVKEFNIDNAAKYVRATVKIDRSSSNTNDMNSNSQPIFKEETLFLKVIMEGEANLYAYRYSTLRRFFYKTKNTNIEQLVYKQYLMNNDKIAENPQFRHQLMTQLACPKTAKYPGLSRQ